MTDRTQTLRYAAFTTDPAGGNPAGVVIGAESLDTAARQAIAADIGYSETAFAEQTDPTRWRVRYHSPLAEVRPLPWPTTCTSWSLRPCRARSPSARVRTWGGPA